MINDNLFARERSVFLNLSSQKPILSVDFKFENRFQIFAQNCLESSEFLLELLECLNC